MDSVEEISSLMSYKLADMVNITLEEGTYFKSEEWCEKNKNKLLVEHDQEDWKRQFLEACTGLKSLEKAENHEFESPKSEVKYHYKTFEPLANFFKTLDMQADALKKQTPEQQPSSSIFEFSFKQKLMEQSTQTEIESKAQVQVVIQDEDDQLERINEILKTQQQ